MDNSDYNKMENAVDRSEEALNRAANDMKWKADEYADRARDYIREQKAKNDVATAEGWMERAKNNVAEAWEDTKDAVSDAWEKTKDWAEDAKAEVRKATN